MRRTLLRAHVWLGWIIGGQLLLWTLSGLVMTAMPIEEVRGEHLRRAPAEPSLALATGLLPPEAFLTRTGANADSLVLRMLDGRPVYELRDGADPVQLRDARTGALIVLDAEAVTALTARRHAGAAPVRSAERLPQGAAPLEFRHGDPAWAVRFDDREGSVFYVHAVTGDLLAVRTDRWRLFDLLWGLHIMDWRGREDMNHPVLVAAAALGFATVLGGLVLLAYRARRRAAVPRG